MKFMTGKTWNCTINEGERVNNIDVLQPAVKDAVVIADIAVTLK